MLGVQNFAQKSSAAGQLNVLGCHGKNFQIGWEVLCRCRLRPHNDVYWLNDGGMRTVFGCTCCSVLQDCF
jgi:hypothetical protein